MHDPSLRHLLRPARPVRRLRSVLGVAAVGALVVDSAMKLTWLRKLNWAHGRPGVWAVDVGGHRYNFGTDGGAFAMVLADDTVEPVHPSWRDILALLSGKPSGVVAGTDLSWWLAGISLAGPPLPARMMTPDRRVTAALNLRLLRRAMGPLKAARVHVVARPIGSQRPFLLYPDDYSWIVGIMPYREVPAKGSPVLRLRKASKLRAKDDT